MRKNYEQNLTFIIIIIIIIIIIPEKNLFEPQPSLEDSASLSLIRPSDFHFFEFLNNNCSTE
jgi:hypothetical protein